MSTDPLQTRDHQESTPSPTSPPESAAEAPARPADDPASVAPAETPAPASPAPAVAVATPEPDAAAPSPPPAVEAPEAAPTTAAAQSDATATPVEEPQKRKVRLSPVIDPHVVKPIPSLATADAGAPPGVDALPAAPPPAAADQEIQTAVAAAEAEAASRMPPVTQRSVNPVAIPKGEELDSEIEAAISDVIQQGGLDATPAAPPAEEGAEAVTEETLEAGAKLQGVIQSVSADSVFLDFGFRKTGIVPRRQFDPKRPPQPGVKLSVTVDKIDEDEGLIHCNLPRGRGKVSHDWSAVVVGQTVECNVSSTNKGGLEVSVGSLRGFLPASQVDLGYVPNLEAYVGQRLSVRVTEVNPARRRLIVSRRQLLAEEREANEASALDEIQPGQTRSGVIRSLKDFGAFVDLGGIDGFLHVGQISWQRINKPSDVLKEGQSVEVKVVSVDREKKRISLSMRQTEQNPWADVEEKYAKGTSISGRVTRIEPFGAFIELEPGVEGLVHISELDHKRVRAVSDVLSANQTVELQVLEVDPKKRRISLSAKALKAKPEEQPREQESAAAEPQRPRKSNANLKGGIGGQTKGGLFGDPRTYS